jgi:hypothetical protein
MKLCSRDIEEFADRLDDFYKSNDDAVVITYTVSEMGSGCDDIIILKLDELEGNSTACGHHDNAHFTPRVIQFLRDQGVEEVIVGVIEPEGPHSDEGNIMICAGAVPIPFDGKTVYDWRKYVFTPDKIEEFERYLDGEDPSPSAVLSYLVSLEGGSWRDDECVEGWSSYESE